MAMDYPHTLSRESLMTPEEEEVHYQRFKAVMAQIRKSGAFTVVTVKAPHKPPPPLASSTFWITFQS